MGERAETVYPCKLWEHRQVSCSLVCSSVTLWRSPGTRNFISFLDWAMNTWVQSVMAAQVMSSNFISGGHSATDILQIYCSSHHSFKGEGIRTCESKRRRRSFCCYPQPLWAVGYWLISGSSLGEGEGFFLLRLEEHCSVQRRLSDFKNCREVSHFFLWHFSIPYI